MGGPPALAARPISRFHRAVGGYKRGAKCTVSPTKAICSAGTFVRIAWFAMA